MTSSNLKVPTSAEARKFGKKGGLASGVARRKKSALKSLAQEILGTKVTDVQILNRFEEMGFEIKGLTFKDVAIINVILNCQKPEDLLKLQKLLGEDTRSKQELKKLKAEIEVLKKKADAMGEGNNDKDLTDEV